MGCGHSNRLTSDQNADNQNTEYYAKIKAIRDKVKKECEDISFKPENEKEYQNMCKEVISKMKGKGDYSDADLTECCYHLSCITKFKLESKSDFNEGGDLIIEIGAEYSKEEKEKVKKIFTNELGSVWNVAYLEIKRKDHSFLTRGLINAVRFGDFNCTADYFAIMMEEESLFCEKTMTALKYMIKNMSKFKSLSVAFFNDDKKEYKTTCFVHKIFQGVELASNLENLTFFRLHRAPIEFKADEIETLIDSISSLKLKSLAIVNLNFVKTSRKAFIQNICSNEKLTMLAIQLDFNIDEFKSIVPLVKGMPKLKLLIVGFEGCAGKEKDFKDEIMKNNPSIEAFQMQYFDKN